LRSSAVKRESDFIVCSSSKGRIKCIREGTDLKYSSTYEQVGITVLS
jgi:hypothetical protein